MFGPIICGEKVDMVPATKDDLPLFVSWLQDREVVRYLGRLFPVSLEDEDEWYNSRRKETNEVIWVMQTKDGNRIGNFGLHRIDWIHRFATAGIMIGDKRYWGQGIATEVLTLGTRFAFEFLGLNSIRLEVIAENMASWRTVEKSGYRFVGVYKQGCYREGRWLDVKIGQILREDWEKTKQG